MLSLLGMAYETHLIALCLFAILRRVVKLVVIGRLNFELMRHSLMTVISLDMVVVAAVLVMAHVVPISPALLAKLVL